MFLYIRPGRSEHRFWKEENLGREKFLPNQVLKFLFPPLKIHLDAFNSSKQMGKNTIFLPFGNYFYPLRNPPGKYLMQLDYVPVNAPPVFSPPRPLPSPSFPIAVWFLLCFLLPPFSVQRERLKNIERICCLLRKVSAKVPSWYPFFRFDGLPPPTYPPRRKKLLAKHT